MWQQNKSDYFLNFMWQQNKTDYFLNFMWQQKKLIIFSQTIVLVCIVEFKHNCWFPL